jgi:Domain of unknown function (DUF397)
MTGIDLSRAEWRKSSYSSQSGNCIEVARNLPGLVAVRDSKEPDVARIVVPHDAWRIFIRNVRALPRPADPSLMLCIMSYCPCRSS